MARTQGHGNPPWTRDETILALDLYFQCDGKIPSRDDRRVTGLSELLRQLPFHQTTARKDTFRNPAGVGFKLQNIRNVATGEGLGNVSEMDRTVWAELSSAPDKVSEIAEFIRHSVNLVPTLGIAPRDGVDDTEEFIEGRIFTRFHQARERNPILRKRLITSRQKHGSLKCDICSTASSAPSPLLEDAIFEAHHVVPLSAGNPRKTIVADLALLCANCHRLVHRAIASERRWLSVSEARSIIIGPRP